MRYKVVSGIMEGLEFNGRLVKINGEFRVWNDDTCGQSYSLENCEEIDVNTN